MRHKRKAGAEVAIEPPEEKLGARSFQELPEAGSRTLECLGPYGPTGELLTVPEATAREVQAWLGSNRSIWSSQAYDSPAGAYVRVISFPDGQAMRFTL